jgi:hypothetical protein
MRAHRDISPRANIIVRLSNLTGIISPFIRVDEFYRRLYLKTSHRRQFLPQVFHTEAFGLSDLCLFSLARD